MDISADHTSSNHSDGGVVGVTYGDIGTTRLRCVLTSLVDKNEYVQIPHESCGMVLGRVDEIERKTDLSLEKAQEMCEGASVDVAEKINVKVHVIGYRDDRQLLQVPHTPFKAGELVYRAEDKLVKEVLGLDEDEKKGAYVGMLPGRDIRVLLDINHMVQKHTSVLAKTGGGKSYLAGAIIEELLKH